MHGETSPFYTARKDDFSLEDWDDRYVLYHRVSQKTHYLNETSAIILQYLVESPCSAERLAAILSEESGTPLSDELCINIAGLLRHLEIKGLAAQIADPGLGP